MFKKIYILFNQIYIYILFNQVYIYCHPQTDCIVVSQLFSLARHVGGSEMGSKPAQLYVRLNILPISYQATFARPGIIRHFVVAFVCLHFDLPDSLEELCIIIYSFISFLSMSNRWTFPRLEFELTYDDVPVQNFNHYSHDLIVAVFIGNSQKCFNKMQERVGEVNVFDRDWFIVH